MEKSFGTWNESEVLAQIKSMGASDEAIHLFVENEVDGESLLECSEDDLKNVLGLRKLGLRYVANCVLRNLTSCVCV
jgi:hypothetical protein